MLQDVSWGCGPGRHPNPWGRCVPNWGGPRYYHGGGYYGGRWGWHHRAWYGHGWHGGGWHGGRRYYRH